MVIRRAYLCPAFRTRCHRNSSRHTIARRVSGGSYSNDALLKQPYKKPALESFLSTPTNNLQHPPHQRPILLIQPHRQTCRIALPCPNALHRLPDMAILALQGDQYLFDLTLVSAISRRYHRNCLQHRLELLNNRSYIWNAGLLLCLFPFLLLLQIPHRLRNHLLLFRRQRPLACLNAASSPHSNASRIAAGNEAMTCCGVLPCASVGCI